MVNLTNPFKSAPKSPGQAFVRMVSELEPERLTESEITREFIQAKLAEASSDTNEHESRTRALLARLFPMPH